MDPPSRNPESRTANYLSAHACSWLVAEFQSIAKDRAREQDEDENFRHRSKTDPALEAIRAGPGSLIIRIIQENRELKNILDTIPAEIHNNPNNNPNNNNNPIAPMRPSTHSSSSASTQQVDIPPFPKWPPGNTPGSGSGTEGFPAGPNNPPPPKGARPDRKRTRTPPQKPTKQGVTENTVTKHRDLNTRPHLEDTAPEDTAMRHSDPHLNINCRPYSHENLYTPKYATLPEPDRTGTQSAYAPTQIHTNPPPPPSKPQHHEPHPRPAFSPLPRFSDYTPPPHPPTEAFHDDLERLVEEGTISPASAPI